MLLAIREVAESFSFAVSSRQYAGRVLNFFSKSNHKMEKQFLRVFAKELHDYINAKCLAKEFSNIGQT